MSESTNKTIIEKIIRNDGVGVEIVDAHEGVRFQPSPTDSISAIRKLGLTMLSGLSDDGSSNTASHDLGGLNGLGAKTLTEFMNHTNRSWHPAMAKARLKCSESLSVQSQPALSGTYNSTGCKETDAQAMHAARTALNTTFRSYMNRDISSEDVPKTLFRNLRSSLSVTKGRGSVSLPHIEKAALEHIRNFSCMIDQTVCDSQCGTPATGSRLNSILLMEDFPEFLDEDRISNVEATYEKLHVGVKEETRSKKADSRVSRLSLRRISRLSRASRKSFGQVDIYLHEQIFEAATIAFLTALPCFCISHQYFLTIFGTVLPIVHGLRAVLQNRDNLVWDSIISKISDLDIYTYVLNILGWWYYPWLFPTSFTMCFFHFAQLREFDDANISITWVAEFIWRWINLLTICAMRHTESEFTKTSNKWEMPWDVFLIVIPCCLTIAIKTLSTFIDQQPPYKIRIKPFPILIHCLNALCAYVCYHFKYAFILTIIMNVILYMNVFQT